MISKNIPVTDESSDEDGPTMTMHENKQKTASIHYPHLNFILRFTFQHFINTISNKQEKRISRCKAVNNTNSNIQKAKL